MAGIEVAGGGTTEAGSALARQEKMVSRVGVMRVAPLLPNLPQDVATDGQSVRVNDRTGVQAGPSAKHDSEAQRTNSPADEEEQYNLPPDTRAIEIVSTGE